MKEIRYQENLNNQINNLNSKTKNTTKNCQTKINDIDKEIDILDKYQQQSQYQSIHALKNLVPNPKILEHSANEAIKRPNHNLPIHRDPGQSTKPETRRENDD